MGLFDRKGGGVSVGRKSSLAYQAKGIFGGLPTTTIVIIIIIITKDAVSNGSG